MSYATGTTHYNLPQTVGTDKRDWFDTNQAFSDIDAAIYGAVQNASQAVTDLSALTTRVGAAENDIDTLETSIGTHTSQISAMQTSITQIGNAVTDNKQDVLDMIESTQEASATATYAHAVGSYFIYNDTLYVTTVAIAVGDTIVPNTNCETTDIGTVLTQLSSDLPDLSDIIIVRSTSVSVTMSSEGGYNATFDTPVVSGYKPLIGIYIGNSDSNAIVASTCCRDLSYGSQSTFTIGLYKIGSSTITTTCYALVLLVKDI